MCNTRGGRESKHVKDGKTMMDMMDSSARLIRVMTLRVGRFFWFVGLLRTSWQAWITRLFTYLLLHWCNFLVTFILCKMLNGDHVNVFTYLLFVGCSAVLEESKCKNCTKRWTPESLTLSKMCYWPDGVFKTFFFPSIFRHQPNYMAPYTVVKGKKNLPSRFIYTYINPYWLFWYISVIHVFVACVAPLTLTYVTIPLLYSWLAKQYLVNLLQTLTSVISLIYDTPKRPLLLFVKCFLAFCVIKCHTCI